MDNLKILEKIQKLKAMGTSSNENEAAIALEMMTKFIEKHNISDDMLAQLQEDKDIVKEGAWHKPRETALKNWEIRLASAIAKLFDCKIIISGKANTYYNGYRFKRNKLLFLGTEYDIKIAIEMYDWINQILWNDAKTKSGEEKKQLNDQVQQWADEEMGGMWTKDDVPEFLRHDGNRFIQSFLVGATARIDARVDDMITARQTKYVDNEQALMIIDMKLTKVKEKMKDMDLNDVTTGLKYSDLNGMQKGQEAGNKVNLDQQLENSGRNDLGQELLK